ncbi:MAG TPA: ABC transporter substrate-binding protein [Candidatus Synoicihabitans sp.]|nr:ABC transporter substrate-binding protein [Candidatus Synoicihabitans sp.]
MKFPPAPFRSGIRSRYGHGCWWVAIAAAMLLGGCAREPKSGAPGTAGAPPRTAIRLQTDWYPQAEHGGFYQALAKGFYAEAGLDVTILPGGPGPRTPQKVIGGAADIAMYRSDDIIVHAATGLPFVFLAAFMQHDPQAILVHDSSPVRTFADLDGKSVMAIPGSNWIQYLQQRYDISFRLVPLNWGIAQFLADKTFIQQCFITNEPYYVRQQGAQPRTLLIAGSGYDPYRGLFTTQRFWRENREAVRAFVAASLRGWEDFMTGDPTPAKKLIAARNEQMTDEFMDYSIAAMRDHELVHGDPARGERLGLITRERLEAQVRLLVELKILTEPIALERFVAFDALPDELQAASGR